MSSAEIGMLSVPIERVAQGSDLNQPPPPRGLMIDRGGDRRELGWCLAERVTAKLSWSAPRDPLQL